MGNHDENLLRSFERKFLRKTFGLVLENRFWKRRKNSIVKFIKFGRIEWAGHVMRMEESNRAKKSPFH